MQHAGIMLLIWRRRCAWWRLRHPFLNAHWVRQALERISADAHDVGQSKGGEDGTTTSKFTLAIPDLAKAWDTWGDYNLWVHQQKQVMLGALLCGAEQEN